MLRGIKHLHHLNILCVYHIIDRDLRKVLPHAYALDNLLLQNGIDAEEVNWVKMDVEGSEFEVFRGATDVMSKSKSIGL